MSKFTGISFPFRIGVRGGVVLSSTSEYDISHIVEAMQQILLTRPLERSMEYHICSDIDTDIFSPNDTSSHTLLKYQINKALTLLEDRVTILNVGITSEDSTLYALIEFKVKKYDTNYITEIKVGEINAENT